MKKQHLHTFGITKIQRIDEEKADISPSKSNLVEDGDRGKNGARAYMRNWVRSSFQKKNFYRKLPILSWLPEYNLTKLVADVIAGLTLGLITIPQVLGVANVAEMPVQYGLYSAFIGNFIYIFLGSTKYITVGPTVTTAIVTLSYSRGQPPEFSVLLCFLTGVIMLVLGVVQLGFIVDFVSKPVISAFTSSAAISIASTQAKSLLGLSFSANGFVEEVRGIIENILDVRWQDILVASISISTLYVLMKIEVIAKRFANPGPKVSKLLWILSTSRSVLVVVSATIVFALIGEPSPVLLVGNVPEGLPSFKPPPFSYPETVGNSTVEFSLGSTLREQTFALIVIPLTAFIEHMTIATAFAGTSRIDANQELFCLGISNILASFFSSMPSTGAFGRTALNHASGAQSPFGGLLTGSIIILALLFLTPQFYYIPKSTLSSVVTMAVIFMIDFDILTSIWKAKAFDLVPWAVTFFVSLFVGLEYGVVCGVAISILYLLYYASRPTFTVHKAELAHECLWVEIDRSMTFPSTDYARYILLKTAKKWEHQEVPVVFDCGSIAFTDYTTAQGVTDILKLFKDRKQHVILWKVKPSVRRSWEVVMSKTAINATFLCTKEELQGELKRFHTLMVKCTKSSREISGDNDNHAFESVEDSAINI